MNIDWRRVFFVDNFDIFLHFGNIIWMKIEDLLKMKVFEYFYVWKKYLFFEWNLLLLKFLYEIIIKIISMCKKTILNRFKNMLGSLPNPGRSTGDVSEVSKKMNAQ